MSTLPGEWAEGDFEGEEEAFGEAMSQQLAPEIVPVRIVHSETERVPPEFAGMMTWSIPQSPGYVQIATRSYMRYKLKWCVNFPGAGTLYVNTIPDRLTNPTPQGFSITVAAAGNVFLPDYDAQQPLYAGASITGVTIATMDERFGKVQ